MELELLIEKAKDRAARLKRLAKRRERRALKRRATGAGFSTRAAKKDPAAAAVAAAKKAAADAEKDKESEPEKEPEPEPEPEKDKEPEPEDEKPKKKRRRRKKKDTEPEPGDGKEPEPEPEPEDDSEAEFEKKRAKERAARAREKAAWDKDEKEVETDRLKKLVAKKAPQIDVPKDWKCPGGYEKDTKKSATSNRKICGRVGAVKRFLHNIGLRKIKDDVEPSMPSLIAALQRSLEE